MERNRELRRASIVSSNGVNRRRHRTNSLIRDSPDEQNGGVSVSVSNQQFSKIFRAAPVWRPGDEIISVSVPRKARSASTKRSHDWNSSFINNGGGGGEQNFRRAWSPAPASPPSSNAFDRKKLQKLGGNNNGGTKVKPPKVSLKKSSSSNAAEELEIEIAEVLFGLKTQSQVVPFSKKDDSKSRISSPISDSNLLECIAPKRKKPRQVPENDSVSANLEKISESTAENVFETRGNMVNSQGSPVQLSPPPETAAQVAEELMEEEVLSSQKGKESPTVRTEDSNRVDSSSTAVIIKGNSMTSEVENQSEEKLGIDLMEFKPEVAKEDKGDKKGTTEETEGKGTVEEAESKKGIENKEGSIHLHLHLENSERDGKNGVNATGAKLQEQREMPLKAAREEPLTENSGQSKNSITSHMLMPMPMPNWPGGLPPMGFMAPTQGVVSMDGTNVAPPPIPSPFTQPQPKRCATHCHIARNIHCLQNFMKMNPFWPGSASLFGSKPCNLNDLHANMAVRGLYNGQDKGQCLAITPNPGGKDKGAQTGSNSDSAQRKQQILFQQSLPCLAPNNLLGPAFIFPINHHQAAAARSSAAKSPPSASGVASSNTSSYSGASASTPVSFNYPNMATNETQYLSVLQSNGYPFPIGALPNYRGTPSPAMPLLNGSYFNSSQIIHPSHLHNHQSQSSQKPQLSQQLQQSHNQHVPPSGSEDSPPTTDTRASRASVNIYGQNFAIHPQNLGNGNQSEKKPQQPSTHSFAKSFGPINGTDITSMAKNHAIFQSLPEATRQNIQMMISAAAHQKKNFIMSEDDKSRNGDSSVTDDERKKLAAKSQPVSSNQASNVIECSARSLNVGPGPARNSQPVTNFHHIQGQLQQQQQMAVNRSKGTVTSNGSLYPENLKPSSTMAATFPNALSGFRQNLVSSSLASSTSTTLKNPPEQHSRNPTQMHTQISFGGNQKPSTVSQGQATPTTMVLSPPTMVGPPTTSSISKGAGGSPTMLTSANNTAQASSLSGQQPKNSSSILGHPSSYSNGAKTQMQLQKNMQQAQLFFSNPYSQAQSPHSNSTSSPSSGPNGYFMQRRRLDQPPTTLANMGTNDPAKAIAAATCNVKGVEQSSQAGIIHAAQFAAAQSGAALLPAGLSYVHPVQVKPVEQKQPAG
ncbi:hypothetical protein BUALT_Bualt12G0131400 [Buddleja alternifolia]|uniref:Protein TIME FOR COFFEE-like n=1 Tax=Buddleja alternifolia TaxID=168488 RepID=A0AAV6WSI2_9LAMI|nr:hypothetical protein BUALT_Bualt12G0131400 [Buddleja alternifolia]